MLVLAPNPKIYLFLEFDTPKIYQQVLRFLDNFAICGLMGSIHIFPNSLLTPDIWGKYSPYDYFRIIRKLKIENPKVYQGLFWLKMKTPKVYQGLFWLKIIPLKYTRGQISRPKHSDPTITLPLESPPPWAASADKTLETSVLIIFFLSSRHFRRFYAFFFVPPPPPPYSPPPKQCL